MVIETGGKQAEGAATAIRDLCFVLMPFGRKVDASGATIDFDAVYHDIIHPAIEDAGLAAIRADEEVTGGIIHKPMFERLVLCKFAVADLTTANANVFYELGVRHAVRPWSTVLLFAEGGRLPFDVGLLRALPYRLTSAGTPDHPASIRDLLAQRLRDAQRAAAEHPELDSPLFQLLDGYPELDRERTDVFRREVEYAQRAKELLASARREGLDAVRRAEERLGPLERLESGVVIDLFLSYRAWSGWDDMTRLVAQMPPVLAQTVLVQEQYALALNRLGHDERAEQVLLHLLERRGDSSETCGILGRVYKDRWKRAADAKDDLLAPALLNDAITMYLRGFESSWTDAYPGVNAVTLMELREPPDPRQAALLPVVRYAVERRIAKGRPDYWDHATALELAVLARDRAAAAAALQRAVLTLREGWEAETTVRNLRLIREVRARRLEDVGWIVRVEDELSRRAPAAPPQ